MGLNFDELFGNVKNSVDQAVTDLKNVGLPAIETSLEKWGADALTKMSQQSQASVDQNLKEILARPQDPDGFGSYLTNTLKSPVVQQYGGVIVGVLAGAALIGYFLFRK